jgi:hypothetical protein
MAKLILDKNELLHLRKNGYSNEAIRQLKSRVTGNTTNTVYSIFRGDKMSQWYSKHKR